MGKGALAGMPLQLAGTRKILEFMDWGEYGAKGTFIEIGSIGTWTELQIYVTKQQISSEILFL